MQQVPDITAVASELIGQVLEYAGNLLRCGMLLVVLVSGSGCDSGSASRGILHSPGALPDKLPPSRILRRGLSGEPRTLDPQLADDTFSLQVVRDLYEGLTAEDRYGRIVRERKTGLSCSIRSLVLSGTPRLVSWRTRSLKRWMDFPRG